MVEQSISLKAVGAPLVLNGLLGSESLVFDLPLFSLLFPFPPVGLYLQTFSVVAEDAYTHIYIAKEQTITAATTKPADAHLSSFSTTVLPETIVKKTNVEQYATILRFPYEVILPAPPV